MNISVNKPRTSVLVAVRISPAASRLSMECHRQNIRKQNLKTKNASIKIHQNKCFLARWYIFIPFWNKNTRAWLASFILLT